MPRDIDPQVALHMQEKLEALSEKFRADTNIRDTRLEAGLAASNKDLREAIDRLSNELNAQETRLEAGYKRSLLKDALGAVILSAMLSLGVYTVLKQHIQTEVATKLENTGITNFVTRAKEAAENAEFYKKIAIDNVQLVNRHVETIQGTNLLAVRTTYFLPKDQQKELWKKRGGEFIEDVENYVPNGARGVVLKVLVDANNVGSGSLVCADPSGEYPKTAHYYQNGFTHYGSFPSGGVIYCPLLATGKKIKCRTISNGKPADINVHSWAAIIGYYD